jgi:phosphate starvation-inducible PhoH-like protein
MKEPNRTRKNEIKYNVQLNEEQKEAKRLILENQIVIITGRAGSGKSLVGSITALDFLNTKQVEKILVTRSAVEVGKSLGFLPGDLKEKFNPYMEALVENLYKCTDRLKIDEFVKNGKIIALPVQFIRGKTVDDVLIVEEAQNLTKSEMEAILTRLGVTGKIIINGDSSQRDINVDKEDGGQTGLDFAIELSKHIDGIEHIKLKENHRSGLVGKILDHVYKK